MFTCVFESMRDLIIASHGTASATESRHDHDIVDVYFYMLSCLYRT